MNFGTVFPGEKYTPSATQQNLLNQMLSNYNTGMTVGGVPDNNLNPNSVRVYIRNASEDYIIMGASVMLSYLPPFPPTFNGIIDNFVCEAMSHNGDARIPVAVSEHNLMPGEVGTAVVAGIALAQIRLTSTQENYNGFVMPSRGSFEPASYGYQVIKLHQPYIYSKTYYGWIVLHNLNFYRTVFNPQITFETDPETQEQQIYVVFSDIPKQIKTLGYGLKNTRFIFPEKLNITEWYNSGGGNTYIYMQLDYFDEVDGDITMAHFRYAISGDLLQNSLIHPFKNICRIMASPGYIPFVYSVADYQNVFLVGSVYDEFTGGSALYPIMENEVRYLKVHKLIYCTPNPTVKAPAVQWPEPTGTEDVYLTLTYNETEKNFSTAFVLSDSAPDGMYIRINGMGYKYQRYNFMMEYLL